MKTKTLLASTIAVVSVLFAASVPVAAVPTTWYVAMNGSDSNACTQSAPCATINHVSACKVHAGDTVLVEPGIYDENLITGVGSIGSVKVVMGGGGSGYALGDVVTIAGGCTGIVTPATFTVTAVSSGAVTGISIREPGAGYSTGNVSPTNVIGSGSNLMINVATTNAIATGASGTAGTPPTYVTYQSQVRWGAVIVEANNDPQGTQPDAWTNYGNYVIIDGFDVVGRADGTHLAGRDGVALAGAPNSVQRTTPKIDGDHSIAQHNRVHGFVPLPPACDTTGGSGISVDATDVEVIGNVIYENGPPTWLFNGSSSGPNCPYVHGIYFKRQYGLGAENLIYGNSGFGIHEFGQFVTDVTVVNNTLFNNGCGSILVGHGDASGHENGGNNNSFTVNNIAYSAAGCTKSDGTTASFGIHDADTSGNSGNVIDNNIAYNNDGNSACSNAGGNICVDDSAYTPRANITTSDPLFISYQPDGRGIYIGRPSLNGGANSESPALDAGLETDTNSSGAHNHFASLFSPYDFPKCDFTSVGSPDPCTSGTTRPDNGGSNFDIGAYESTY